MIFLSRLCSKCPSQGGTSAKLWGSTLSGSVENFTTISPTVEIIKKIFVFCWFHQLIKAYHTYTGNGVYAVLLAQRSFLIITFLVTFAVTVHWCYFGEYWSLFNFLLIFPAFITYLRHTIYIQITYQILYQYQNFLFPNVCIGTCTKKWGIGRLCK